MADAPLFQQYENEYCNKSTDISRKIGAIGSLSGGERALYTATFAMVSAWSPRRLAGTCLLSCMGLCCQVFQAC
jgi:hypothetical protein